MRTAVAILLLVVIAALGWLLWFAPAPEPPREGPRPPVPEPAAVTASPPSPPSVATDAVAVIVEVSERGRIEAPLPAPQFEVWRGQQRLPLPVIAIAGAHAGQFESAAGDRTLVRLDLGTLGSCWRAVTVADDVPTPIRCGPGCKVSGRVLDGKGLPVAAARIWTGEVEPGGAWREVETDAEGSFTADVMQGGGVPCVVQKVGLASRVQWLDLGPAGASEVLLTLAPETLVAVQCLAVADSMQGAEVGVLPGDQASTGMLQWPFFLQAVLGLTALDDSGKVLLRGLPRDSDFRIVVRHPRAVLSIPVDVALRGEHVAAAVPLQLLPALSGRITDTKGHPVADAQLRLQLRDQRPLPNARWMLPESLCLAGACLGSTAADGSFGIGFAGARGRLTVRRPDGAALAIEVDAPGPLPRDLPLPEWVDGPTQLQLPPASPAPWLARIKPLLTDFAEVPAGQPFAQLLPQPLLADLRVLIRRDGKWSSGKEVRDAVLIGSFVLPLALLQ